MRGLQFLAAGAGAFVGSLWQMGAPRDVRIDTPATGIVASKGWLHSAYRESRSLIDAL